jgi:amino acid adenylation domain-containing protein
MSDDLALDLIANGARVGSRIGILMPKSYEAVVAIYGALKAGCGYVPLDVSAPLERLRTVLDDCGVQCVLTNKAAVPLAERLTTREGGAIPMVCLDAATWQRGDATPGRSALPVDLGPNPLAYILYTSGSTGVPKGIVHSHRSALAFVDWAADTLQPTDKDRFSSHAPFHFDLSTLDLFVSAKAGATLALIPEDTVRMPASLSALVEHEEVTIWYSVPFALVQLVERGALAKRRLKSLRWVLFAGEPMPVPYLDQLRRFLPGARFANLYGPTETNVCTAYVLPPGPVELDDVPIGRAASGDRTRVTDADGRDVAVGGIGELLVRGESVMAGYWSPAHVEASEAGNLASPYREADYHTGDLVQVEADGSYRFKGRRDRQVKVRGYRIELDEIERILRTHTDVGDAAAFVTRQTDALVDIEAAVVPRARGAFAPSDVLSFVAQRLPAQAVPARLSIHDAFPRTATGKVDRHALVEAHRAAVIELRR